MNFGYLKKFQMLRIALLFALAVAIMGSSLFDPQYDDLWEKYKASHNKTYSLVEDGVRRLIWEKAIRQIAKHNLEADMGLHTYRMGLNQFADMTDEEFDSEMLGNYRNRARIGGSTFLPPSHITVPDEVDWRREGLVTRVKNQRKCGSCWAFSAIGAVEGQHKRKTGKLVSLSEQNLVDCSWKYGNEGCNGGYVHEGFQYIINNGGIDTEESYPYTARDDQCRFNSSNVGATITGYQDIDVGDENALLLAVATVGPVSVSIDANNTNFKYYKGGVYVSDECTTTELNHSLLVVGYGTENGQDYWLVKNSWSSHWGEDGYIKMARNRNNMCGIVTDAVYPLV